MNKYEQITALLKEITQEIESIEVATITEEGARLSSALEETMYQTSNLKDGLDKVMEAYGELDEKVKEKGREYMDNHTKQKKYEGEKVSLQYRIVRKFILNGEYDPKFAEAGDPKPNSQKIKAYEEATGKLPAGVGEKVGAYLNYKAITTDEA